MDIFPEIDKGVLHKVYLATFFLVFFFVLFIKVKKRFDIGCSLQKFWYRFDIGTSLQKVIKKFIIKLIMKSL